MEKRTEVALKAVKEAMTVIRKHVLKNKVIAQKTGIFNDVTEADLASNKVIFDLLKTNFPNDLILSEETVSSTSDFLQSSRLWVIDPLDGTANFQRGRQYSAVSVGFVEKGEPLLGVCGNITTSDIYLALKGKGAIKNNRPIHVSVNDRLDHCIIATETGYQEEVGRANLKTITNLPKLPWLIAGGSAVLEFCEVAQGSVDLFIHRDLKPWDNAAGYLIIKEAGGVFWDLKGNNVPYTAGSVITGSHKLAKQVLQYI